MPRELGQIGVGNDQIAVLNADPQLPLEQPYQRRQPQHQPLAVDCQIPLADDFFNRVGQSGQPLLNLSL